MIELMTYNILYYVGTMIIIFIILTYILYLIINFTFFYQIIKLSSFLYNEQCLQNFINNYGDYYLDIHMTSGDEIKSVKVLHDNIEHQIIGILEYLQISGKKGSILKGKLKNITLSPMYVDYNNWKKVEKDIKLPDDMKWYISKFIADKKCNCEKIERSDDKKYFDSV